MKILYLLKKIAASGICALVATSCNLVLEDNGISGNTEYKFVEKDGQIMTTYFSKDETANFFDFLTTEKEKRMHRGIAESNLDDQTDEVFLELWEQLSDSEKAMLLAAPEEVKLQVDEMIATDVTSNAGRNIKDNNNFLDMSLAHLQFVAKLNYWFGEKEIPVNLIPHGIDAGVSESVPAVAVIEKYASENDWATLETFLNYLSSPVSVQEIKTAKLKFLGSDDIMSESRASSASLMTDYADTPLVANLGASLKDGSVVLTAFKKKAYVLAGTYGHGGIFSKNLYDKEKNDKTHCVYTAQPDSYDSFPVFLKPDRPGYACLDTLDLYTYKKRLAALLPKNYTEQRGMNAVNVAKTLFYDSWVKYNLPIWEAIYILDSSHDGTNKNTYCTKVAYTAWKKAGADLDAKTFAGNLVTPDDIYASAYDRYSYFTISFLWWSKTWTKKIYSATSNLIMERSR